MCLKNSLSKDEPGLIPVSLTDKNSAFAVDKLIYKMLGFRLAAGEYRGERGGMT
jgi:hypothetical protein